MNGTFVIAEIGINHNGDMDTAKKLIDAAVFAGADAVKFQKRTIDKVYANNYLVGYRDSKWGKTQRDQKEGLEFGKEEYDEIDKYCKEKKIHWFASPWDLESVEFLKQYNLQYNKIASPMLTHRKLLHAIAVQCKHTFISTGMSTMDEIREAVEIFENYKCPYYLLHCNSQYPMPEEKANLNMIKSLRSEFINRDFCKGIGYSGHEVGLIISVSAVVMGANIIERHITLDRSMYGSDQASSIEPMGLYRLVGYVRTVEEIMGDGIKNITEEEEKGKENLRRNVDY